MSLLPECYRWSERAILALDDATRGGVEEMHLQAGIGISSTYLHGQGDAARHALERSVAIAEERGDALNQIALLGLLRIFHFRSADFNNALSLARRCRALAETIKDPAAIALAHAMLGRSLYFLGDLNAARVELEASLQHWSRAERSTAYIAYQFNYTVALNLARTLWLQGHPTQAGEQAHQALKIAAHLDRPTTLVVALAWGVSVFLWIGDFESVEKYADSIIYLAETHSIGPFVAIGRARKEESEIRRGDVKKGVESLRALLKTIHTTGVEYVTTEFNVSIAQGLEKTGRVDEAMTLIDDRIKLVEGNGEMVYMAELLRVKGRLLLSMSQPSLEEAERCFVQSIELSRQQGALAWELRTATDLATLHASQGHPERGRTLLQPVYKQFVEGFDTADLKAAKSLLASP